MFCFKSCIAAIVLISCTCLFPVSIHAQNKPTEKREMFFRILEIRQLSKDSLYGAIAGGTRHGIAIGQTGAVKGVYKAGLTRSEMELGFASVITVGDSLSMLSFSAKNTEDSELNIHKGDYVKLSIKVPKLPYRSIFFELALMDIDFNNISRKSLYTLDDLLFRDSKKLEDSLLKASAGDVIETYDMVKDDTTFNSLRVPLTDGRYKGRGALDVMGKVSPKDVYGFLSFVKGYPGKYIGNTWKMNETFATWVINNAPYSEREILDSLKSYKSNATALKKFIEINRELIIKDDYVRGWISSAIDFQDLDQNDQADELLEISGLVIKYLKDDCSTGFYNYGAAQLRQNRLQYKEAILYCDSAIASFNKCGNKKFELESYFKKAYCLRNTNKYDEALAVYAQVDKRLNTNDAAFAPNDMASAQSKYYREIGYTYNLKGDFKKAIDPFIKAIKLLKAQNTFESLNSASDILLLIAGIYKEQGEYSLALDIYMQQLTTYKYLGDKKNEASVLDNLGFIQAKLGNYKDAIKYHEQAKWLHLLLKDLSSAGYAQSQIGQALWNLGRYDSAIAAHKAALQFRKQAEDASGQAYSWKKLASLYNLVGQKNLALASYDSTAFYYAIAKDSVSLLENLLDVGGVYQTDNQHQKAFEYYSRAHALNVKRGNKSAIMDSYFKMGSATYHYDTAASRKNYTASYNLAKEIGDKENTLYAALNIGLLANRTYDYDRAEKFFNEGLQLSIEEKSKSNEAYAYVQIGNGLTERFEFDKAITVLSKALHIYDSLGERSQLPGINSSIGSAYQGKGDFETSLSYFEKAKQTGYEIKSMADVAIALNSMSYVYALKGDNRNAFAAADSGLSIFKKLNNNWQVGNSYITFGNVYNLKDEYKKAIEYYSLADSMFILEKDNLSRSTVKNNIGDIYFLQSDYDKALKYFLESEKAYEQIKSINESLLITRANIGETYYHQKDYDKAMKYMTDVYARSKEKNIPRTLSSANLVLGQMAFDKNNFIDAEKYLTAAKQIALKSNEANKIIESYLYLGKLYAKQNKTDSSLQSYRNGIDFSRKVESTRSTWELLYEVGMTYYSLNRFDSAADIMKTAVAIVETKSENLFGGAEAKKIFSSDFKKADLYNKLVASLIKTNKGNEALYYADKSNSQGVKEMLEHSGITTGDKDKKQALQKVNELAQTQTAIENTIAKETAKPAQQQNKVLIDSLIKYKQIAAKDYLNYINNLVKTYPDLQVYFNKTNPVDFKNYMEYIPDSTIVVLYVINDNQLYLFTATKDETLIKIVDLKTDINQQAAKFLSMLKNPGIKTGTDALKTRSTVKIAPAVAGDYKKEASALYDLLITPIADQLKDKKNLCIIPNGKLSNIPFQALGNFKEGNAFHFLVEDYRVFYTNKLEIFMKPYKQQQMLNSFVAFGNPDKSLPKATLEVNNLIKIISSGKSYIEDAATEDIAKTSLKDFRYIHLATHGVLDYSDFEKSFLLFGVNKSFMNEDGVNEDGKLTIQEINGLAIKDCDLVTLSACETAVSQESVKGWYISPANSFLANRVKSVVASLWQVDDDATSILMDEFYKNLQTMPKAEALRKAQETLSKNPKYTHPYYWSAFVLYGDWR